MSNVKHWGFYFYDEETYYSLTYENNQIAYGEGSYNLVGASTIELWGPGTTTMLNRKSLLATMSVHESTLTLEFKCSAKYKGKVYTEKLLKDHLKTLIKKDQEENQL